MIHDELSQEAKLVILNAMRDGLGLKYHRANSAIVAELDKSGYGNSFGRNNQFVLTSQAISEIVDILKSALKAY